MQRAYNEPIPFCRGVPLNSADYCVKPSTEAPVDMLTMSPTTAATMAATEMIVALQVLGDDSGMSLGICQGGYNSCIYISTSLFFLEADNALT